MSETIKESPSVPPEEEKKEENPKFRFKFEPLDFTIDAMLVNGFVRGAVIFNDNLKAVYRSLTVEDLQDVELQVDPQDKSKSYKFVMNELTIRQLYHALESINGQTLPPPPPKDVDEDKRREKLRSIPGQLLDQLIQGLNEFEARVKMLVAGENLANF